MIRVNCPRCGHCVIPMADIELAADGELARLAAALTEAERREGELREALERVSKCGETVLPQFYGNAVHTMVRISELALVRSTPSTPAADKGEGD